MIRLSIIVPFYNVEPYIEQCIRSLYDQDIPLEEYEVICVDDCSPDGSRAIVERLQKEYPTLQLICHTENKRQGGARNTGLAAVKGEYIWFVDSDDYVLPNVMGKLLKDAERNELDILQFEAKCTIGGQKIFISEKSVSTGIEYVLGLANAWSYTLPLMWKTLFRRSFLVENRLQFVEGYQYEDTDFSLRAYYMAKRVMHIANVAYFYRDNPESTTRKKDTPNKMLMQVLLVKRVSEFSMGVQNSQYRKLLDDYVRRESSKLGVSVSRQPLSWRLRYLKEAALVDITAIRKKTSFRNWLRIKYGVRA